MVLVQFRQSWVFAFCYFPYVLTKNLRPDDKDAAEDSEARYHTCARQQIGRHATHKKSCRFSGSCKSVLLGAVFGWTTYVNPATSHEEYGEGRVTQFQPLRESVGWYISWAGISVGKVCLGGSG